MTNIQDLLHTEYESIREYDPRIDNSTTNILKLPNIICPGTPPPNILELINQYKDDLRYLRFGIITSNIESSLTHVPLTENIINDRIEFAGHIDIRSSKCTVSATGTNGAIDDFILSPDKINFHTHPPYNGKWPFAPPSEIDIRYLITQQKGKTETIYNAVSTREGIYIYYLHPNFFNNDNTRYFQLFFQDEYRELKNKLGYSSSGTRLFGGVDPYASPNKSQIITSEKVIRRSSIKQSEISINTFLNTVNSVGICTHLIPYDRVGGGSKTYPITYSIN